MLLQAEDVTQWEELIEQHVTRCTFGRIRHLRVEIAEHRVAVHGIAGSYYVKQLAIHGLKDALELLPLVAGSFEIDVDINCVSSRAREPGFACQTSVYT